jgi:uncharacterized membrane protein
MAGYDGRAAPPPATEREHSMTDTPTDPTDANPTTRIDPPATTGSVSAAPPPAAPPAPPIAPSVPPPPPSPPPGWRSVRNDPGRAGTVILGVILLGIGLWFLADQTLGLDMPSLRLSQLWPFFLIGFGAWIAVGSMRRR